MNWYDSDIVSIDVETTGKEWTKDRVFGVAIAWIEDGRIKSDYFDVRDTPARYRELMLVSGDLKRVVNHNIKFDAHMLMNDGIKLPLDRCECTMIRAALIDEHLLRYDLDSTAKRYLKKAKVGDIYAEMAELFGGKATRTAQMPNLHRAPFEMVKRYAAVDAELALELWLWQETEIKKQDLGQVWSLEQELFQYIVGMERGGIRVDLEDAERRSKMLTSQINKIQKKLDDIAGFAVNANPSGSISQLFKPTYDESKKRWFSNDGTPLPTTPGGKPSLGADALKSMRHPAAALVLQVRKLIKTRDTFIGGHIVASAMNGRVHPNINQTKSDEDGGTGTGRLSYTKPALQQIPSRDKEIAKIVRPIFLPDENMGWSYGDLDQHELRIFHHYVNNPSIVQAYIDNPNLDGHQAVAELTGMPRNAPASGGANAKQMNLGMVFNMGGGELASAMGMEFTIEEIEINGVLREIKRPGLAAQKIIDDYYEMVPGVKEISKKARSIAKSRGFVKTLKGRHIRFPRGDFAYKASGLVYQGTAGDLNKENIMRICKYLKSECPEGRLLLNIHDEYSISLPFGGAKKHLTIIRDEIQNRPEVRIPLRIDFSEPASNWWDATISQSIT